jgi:hypothetical protein
MDAQIPCNPITTANAIINISRQPGIPSNITKALSYLAFIVEASETQCSSCDKIAALPELMKELKMEIRIDIDSRMESVEDSVRNLNDIAAGLERKVMQVSDSSTQLANTATTYRDALLNGNTGAGANSRSDNPDPALNVATSRKARQVMIQLTETDLNTYSHETLMEKATQTIAGITHPPPPEGIKITEITKLKKGAIILLFNTKEAADWIQHEDVEVEFTVGFISGATLKQRQYALLVPRIPLSFNPENGLHLREIEEVNGLANNAIAKARWIKPESRRRAGQTVAHATFIFNSVRDANKCIMEGLLVCSSKVYPSKMKQEPTQYMKCRRWGHFATECDQPMDTCGTCGGNHRTSTCNGENGRFCVSCNDHSHASWDRMCPEFARRCAWYDERHPENLLKYFPTEDAWTQTTRPERIPIPERFPARFAVGSLPPSNRYGRDLPTRPIERRPKQPRRRNRRHGTQQPSEGQPPPSQRTVAAPGREQEDSSFRSSYHTPTQMPPNWDDASSFDDRTSCR